MTPTRFLAALGLGALTLMPVAAEACTPAPIDFNIKEEIEKYPLILEITKASGTDSDSPYEYRVDKIYKGTAEPVILVNGSRTGEPVRHSCHWISEAGQGTYIVFAHPDTSGGIDVNEHSVFDPSDELRSLLKQDFQP